MMSCHWNSLAALSCLVLFAGCATNKDQLLTHDNLTMLDVWHSQTTRTSDTDRRTEQTRALSQQISGTNASVHGGEPVTSYRRSAANEIESLFKRLPNPDLVMFVFPHLAGTEQVPIPGYSTVFPLFRTVQYALPGERTEDY